MRKLFYLAGLLLIVACSSDDDNNDMDSQTKLVTFTVQTEGNATRAQLTDEGIHVVWDEGDMIRFKGDKNNVQECRVKGYGTTSTTFDATVGTDETSFVALHPCQTTATRSGQGFTSIDLPSTQTATNGSCDKQTTLMMAHANSSTSMAFKNLCSCIKVSVPDSLANKSITKIVFEAAGKQLAGIFGASIDNGNVTYTYPSDTISYVSLVPKSGGKIDAGTYYISILPTTITTGTDVATLTFVTNSGIYSTSYTIPADKQLKCERNKNVSLPIATKQKFIKDEAKWVDLGETDGEDKILWYSRNIGATSITDGGDFYAWAEIQKQYSSICTEDKTTNSGQHYYDITCTSSYPAFSQNTAPYYQDNNDEIKYNKYNTTDAKKVLEKDDDVAYKTLGSSNDNVYIPYQANFQWLFKNCTWRRTDNYLGTGTKGFIVTSTIKGYEGNSIFLPCVGFCEEGMHKYFQRGIYTAYWISSVAQNVNYAYCLRLNWSKSWDISAVVDPTNSNSTLSRHVGCLIRPVKKIKN